MSPDEQNVFISSCCSLFFLYYHPTLCVSLINGYPLQYCGTVLLRVSPKALLFYRLLRVKLPMFSLRSRSLVCNVLTRHQSGTSLHVRREAGESFLPFNSAGASFSRTRRGCTRGCLPWWGAVGRTPVPALCPPPTLEVFPSQVLARASRDFSVSCFPAIAFCILMCSSGDAFEFRIALFS